MRILTLLAGGEALPDVVRLTDEIREFNSEIDFRLRFLHIEIEEIYALPPGLRGQLEQSVARAEVREVDAADPLEAAARLALLLSRERPDVVIVAGDGVLHKAGVAAARVCGTKLAFYGPSRGSAEGALDLGAEPRAAVERLTGVARVSD
ncbi:MAG TPA: hypothetical protein VFY93_10030 [Planctomycetota bacterium]|nr:hypothetical protein [Planctomycetota bacterium]